MPPNRSRPLQSVGPYGSMFGVHEHRVVGCAIDLCDTLRAVEPTMTLVVRAALTDQPILLAERDELVSHQAARMSPRGRSSRPIARAATISACVEPQPAGNPDNDLREVQRAQPLRTPVTGLTAQLAVRSAVLDADAGVYRHGLSTLIRCHSGCCVNA